MRVLRRKIIESILGKHFAKVKTKDQDLIILFMLRDQIC